MRSKMAALFLLLVLVLVLLLFLQRFSSSSSYRPPPHRPASHRTGPNRPGSSEGDGLQYEVMFDAGSTGTRVHVFRFQMENPGFPSLDRETFRAVEPGLSAYADDPQKCSAGVVALLDLARSVVPPSQWTRTPVVLKATAGLRLLPGDRAEQLLDRVRALFQESPFLSTEDSVSIMDGTDEGISAWITINFLTGEQNQEVLIRSGAWRTGGSEELGRLVQIGSVLWRGAGRTHPERVLDQQRTGPEVLVVPSLTLGNTGSGALNSVLARF